MKKQIHLSENVVKIEKLRVMCERLMFPRGVLALLKETELFAAEVDRALTDIDHAIDMACKMQTMLLNQECAVASNSFKPVLVNSCSLKTNVRLQCQGNYFPTN